MSERRDSNPRPSAWKANALSTELLSQIKQFEDLKILKFENAGHLQIFKSIYFQIGIVGSEGFEPPKSKDS